MSLKIDAAINSYQEAEALVLSYWCNFREWVLKECISHNAVFDHLDKIVTDLIQSKNDNDGSIRYHIKRFTEDEESARIYRHIRDFGSLKHFDSQRDIRINNFFKSLIKQLKERKETELRELLLEINQNNPLELFIENGNLFENNIYKKLFNISEVKKHSLLTKIDYKEAISFLKSNIKITLLELPWDSLKSSGFSKMFRIMIGTIMYAYYGLPDGLSRTETSKILLQALKIGYYFGVSYPLIDNVFDSKHILSNTQKQSFANILTNAISGANVSGQVPNISFLKELYRCCLELQKLIKDEESEAIFNYIRIAHLAQIEDNLRDLSSYCETDDIFTKLILKSAFTRIAIASLAGYKVDKQFIHNSIIMGLNNQLSNDFEGVIGDLSNDIATPYTLFLKGNFALNPLVCTFDYYLFSASFQSNPEIYIRACCLRFVETVHEFIKTNGIVQYENLINSLTVNNILSSKKELFYKLGETSKYIVQVHQEGWFSELLDTCAKKYILKNNEKKNAFDFLKFKSEVMPWLEIIILNDQLNELEKYALSGSCQRNRPLLCLLMAKIYGLNFEDLTGLLRAIEYFHTASLILDDLPAQDNADFRRGKLALHKKYGESAAQITAVSLIAKGYYELGNIVVKDNTKLKIIQYASHICSSNGLCLGQMKDLRCSDVVSLEELIEIASLKTGLAIEFCLLSVSIMVNDSPSNIENFKLFAKYTGIAYQIKDDLNDCMSLASTGKDQFLDRKNNRLSFFYLIGYEKSKELLETYKNLAINSLLKIDLDVSILREFSELFFAFT